MKSLLLLTSVERFSLPRNLVQNSHIIQNTIGEQFRTTRGGCQQRNNGTMTGVLHRDMSFPTYGSKLYLGVYSIFTFHSSTLR